MRRILTGVRPTFNLLACVLLMFSFFSKESNTFNITVIGWFMLYVSLFLSILAFFYRNNGQ